MEVNPGQVRAMLDGAGAVLIDCREEDEWRRARIEGARLIPLGELGARIDELADELAEELAEEERPVIVYCHHGVRSLKGAALLRSRGVEAKSMAGGIDRWSREVDGAVLRY